MEELPKVERISVSNYFIDGTPDGKYAVRILKAFRSRCNERWVVDGVDERSGLLYKTMNEHQVLRAKELDTAIAILEKER